MAKITRKSYKRNKITFGLALFAGIALISTGFAAFVISSATKTSSTGNVNVGITKNNVLKITDTTLDAEKRFDFEPISGYEYIGPESKETEKLSLVLTGNIENAAQFKSLTFKMEEHTGVTNAVNGEYIVAPTCYNSVVTLYEKDSNEHPLVEDITNTDGVKRNDDGTYSYRYTISFSWGSVFKGMNPSQYYTEDHGFKDGVDTDAAQTTLDKMRAAFLDMTYDEYAALSEEEQKDQKVADYSITITGNVN